MAESDWMQQLLIRTRGDFLNSGVPVRHENLRRERWTLDAGDGTPMVTWGVFPEGVDRVPVIIQRSCYPWSEPWYRLCGEELARRGYGYLCQYCRGTGGSGGRWEPNIHERADGLALMQWLETQPWASSAGFWGSSYLALTGWAVADILTPKFRAMCLSHYGTDRHVSAWQQGLFRQDVLTAWAMDNAGAPVAAGYEASCRYQPHARVDEDLWGISLPWYREMVTQPDVSSPFWQNGFWKELRDIPGRVKVPVLMLGGWFDHHLGSMMSSWSALSEETRRCSRFVAGSWNHGFGACTGPWPAHDLQNSEIQHMLQWFEQTLVRHQRPEGGTRWYITGAGCWEKGPEQEDDSLEDFLLFLSNGDESLTQTPPSDVQYRLLVSDPDNPVPSHGAESMLRSQACIGSLPQPDIGYREDVMSFVSGVTNAVIRLRGPVTVSVYTSSDTPDAALTFRFSEVLPDGTAWNIRTSGAVLSSGTVCGSKRLLEIHSWPVGWDIQPGSRMRLDIAPSDFPQYSIHPNTEGVWSQSETACKARQTVWMGGDAPSCLILKVRR